MINSDYFNTPHFYNYWNSAFFSSSPISRIAKHIFQIQYQGLIWKANIWTTKKVTNESGSTDQFKIKMQHDNRLINARTKKTELLNEAIVYYQMQQKQDALQSFLPKFIGVFNEEGKQIDLESLLKQYSISELCRMKEYQTVYLVIEDLVDNLPQAGQINVKTPKDFKFVKKPLQSSDLEVILHNRKQDNLIKKFVRNIFFSLSGCSFAFQQATKSPWYTLIISYMKRILSVRKTKSILQKQFARLPQEQLKKVYEKLKKLKLAIYSSNYAMADASLLFIPIEKKIKGQWTNELNIHLIDMCYAFSKDELNDEKSKKDYLKMKQAMLDSIDELIGMVAQNLKR